MFLGGNAKVLQENAMFLGGNAKALKYHFGVEKAHPVGRGIYVNELCPPMIDPDK